MAQAAIAVRVTVDGEPIPASEPSSGLTRGSVGSALQTAALADEALYLLHTSPLRAAVIALAPLATADCVAVEACRYGAARRPVVLCRIGGACFVLQDHEARDEARNLLVNVGGDTDPATELANHVAGCLISAVGTLDRAQVTA